MKNKLFIAPPPDKMTMKKIISVYIIFAFLLTSFAGCGKLKNIVGLSQPEAPIPPKVDNQPDTSASSEVDSQSDTSASSEVDSQPETSASPEVNSQPETPAPPKVNNQSDNASGSENQTEKIDCSCEAKDVSRLNAFSYYLLGCFSYAVFSLGLYACTRRYS